ncbi:LysR family transcriptional regulator [Erythrobacter sp. F6033]|uniref:LysR family transcriptional regulator n=1 Tax=Erythrobacter sp. F6033 TaxID=2926401 RepID=UPI001FF3E596|nr:LysR family transcriptional regulator [Erythrobacter sp. F6033]MCK0129254.1 LysR family transcriptional regulator [Erythrobacter sp. F6033]
MMNWDDYRLVLAMARAGSIRGAASLLSVNHATVSRRLAQLGDAIGDPVFERVAGGYRPTLLGNELVAAAEKMELVSTEAERRSRALSSDLRGPVKLSIPEVIGRHLLLDDLNELVAEYPDIELTIDVSYDFADLNRSQADIVVRNTPSPPDHFVGRRLFPLALCHYCKRGYLEAVPENDRVWLTRSRDTAHLEWIARSPFPDAGLGPVIEDIGLRHEAAARGQGMIFGACYIADSDPRMMRIAGSTPEPLADLWVLTHPDLKKVPRISQTMSFLYERLSRHRDLIEGRLPRDNSL